MMMMEMMIGVMIELLVLAHGRRHIVVNDVTVVGHRFRGYVIIVVHAV